MKLEAVLGRSFEQALQQNIESATRVRSNKRAPKTVSVDTCGAYHRAGFSDSAGKRVGGIRRAIAGKAIARRTLDGALVAARRTPVKHIVEPIVKGKI